MNIQEVAKRAAVSTATVSRTINGSDKVSPETAKRVRRAIEDLNYYPDTNARALGSGRSRLYGLIISDITNPFFPELVRSFEEVAVQHGQEVVVANTGYDPKRTELCVQRMLERKVDGVAIMTSEMGSHLVERLSSRRIPMVFLDTGSPGVATSNILIEYSRGVDAAVAHLVELGHELIGFISGPMTLASARIRHDSFLASLKRNGIAIHSRFLQEGDHRIEGGRKATERLIAEKKRPTAILCSNDLTAIGALGAIHHAGLHVPGHFSIIGFDDIEISSSIHPALTTVRLSRTQIAERAFRALFASNHAREAEGQEYKIRPELIIRESTAPPAENKTSSRPAPASRRPKEPITPASVP
ncbi:MAG TPA: LacI family DNA-binding transcriptional regulator [Acidobacteriaceae bacterium]|nr:LacI family DNA-binding transcriptional regulator [Acidobacteriaceae bacterium]